MITHKIALPADKSVWENVNAGDRVLLSGVLYTARDEAHKRLIKLIKDKKDLPVDLKGQVIYYMGPAPAKPDQIINSAGPTTAKRMDIYTSDILKLGVLGTIGKGERGPEAKKIMLNKAVYMVALGGVAAKLSKQITKQEIVAFEDLGMGAFRTALKLFRPWSKTSK